MLTTIKDFTTSVVSFSREIGQITLSESEASALLELLKSLQMQVQLKYSLDAVQKSIAKLEIQDLNTSEKIVDFSGFLEKIKAQKNESKPT